MKKMKKIASIILSMVMALVMTIPAFAAPETTSASITIHNVAEGATYTVYKVFGATYSGTGNDQLVAYTYPTDSESQTKWDENKSVLDQYFKWNRTTGVVEPKDSDNISQIFVVNDDTKESVAALKNALKNIGTQVDTKTATNGNDLTVNVSTSGFGYYLVESSRGTETAIAVDNVTPNAEIFDKNVSYPTWDDSGKKVVIVNAQNQEEEVDVSSCGIGDEVTFRLHITAQNYAQKSDDINSEFKQIDKYIIKDDLANGAFTLVENSVKVTVNNANITNFTKTDATAPEKGFIVNIPWIDAQDASLYEANSELVIEYKATLQDTAVIAGAGNVNKAKLGWTVVDNDTPDKPGTQDEVEATVYTYALAFYKTNADNQELSGAEFEITGPNGKIYATGESYPYTNAKFTDTGAKSAFVTGNDGLIIIKGVPAGTYSVTETKAPEGYNKLAEAVNVEAQLQGTYTQKITIYKDGDGKVVSTEVTGGTTEEKNLEDIDFGVAGLTIVNKAGQLLPSTGGIGTTIFYVLGGILVIGAGIMLVVRKRMGSEK